MRYLIINEQQYKTFAEKLKEEMKEKNIRYTETSWYYPVDDDEIETIAKDYADPALDTDKYITGQGDEIARRMENVGNEEDMEAIDRSVCGIISDVVSDLEEEINEKEVENED